MECRLWPKMKTETKRVLWPALWSGEMQNWPELFSHKLLWCRDRTRRYLAACQLLSRVLFTKMQRLPFFLWFFNATQRNLRGTIISRFDGWLNKFSTVDYFINKEPWTGELIATTILDIIYHTIFSKNASWQKQRIKMKIESIFDH